MSVFVSHQSLKLHPWNRSFQWTPARHRGGLLDPAQCKAFDRDGYLILRGLVATSLVEDVRSQTDEYESEQLQKLRAEGGRNYISEVGAITFNAHLVASFPELRRFASHEEFAGVALDLVGPDVNLYWDQSVYKAPEKPRRFPWHQDNGYIYVEPQQYLTCWVPLVDATLQNGCPQLVPGLHHTGTLRHTYVDPLGWECFDVPPEEPVVAEARPGDVVVFSSLTPHMTGPNVTDATRKAYILQYVPTGAAVLRGDPSQGPPTDREPCDNPETQIPVLREGQWVNT